MANLPDLDTTQVGFIAYWNALDDGGVAAIDPEEMLDDSNINSYTLYDNGFVASYSNPVNSLPVTVRAKTDGWITVHTDSGGNFNASGERDPGRSFLDCSGWWNIATGPNRSTGGASLTNHVLRQSIGRLQGFLTNSGSITYNSGDVGLYHYEFPDATNTTLAYVDQNGDNSSSGGISYTSTTTIDAVAAFGYANSKEFIDQALSSFEGVELADAYEGTVFGSLDAVENNLVGSSGTEYTLTASGGGQDADSYTAVVALWH
jgi:hypothetical protein